MTDNARVTQTAIEVVGQIDNPKASVSQLPAEVIYSVTNPQANISQVPVEVLYTETPAATPVSLDTTISATSSIVSLRTLVQTLVASTLSTTPSMVSLRTLIQTLSTATLATTASVSTLFIAAYDYAQALTTGSAFTPTFTRVIAKSFVLALTTTASVLGIKALLKSMSATLGSTATLDSITVLQRALIAGVSLSASFMRSISKVMTLGITNTFSLIRTLSRVLTLSLTGTGVLEKSKMVPVIITATVGLVATAIKSYARTISGALSVTSSVVRDLFFVLTSGFNASVSLSKAFLQTLVATVVSVVTILRLRRYAQLLNTGIATVVSIVDSYSQVVASNVLRARAYVGRGILRAAARLGLYGDDR